VINVFSYRDIDDKETEQVRGVHISMSDKEVVILTENFPTRKWDTCRIPRSVWDEFVGAK
jgi:hypothetical protein